MKFCTLMLIMVVGVFGVVISHAEQTTGTINFTTRSGTGPETQRTSQKVFYSLEGTAMSITAYLPSDIPDDDLFLKLTLIPYTGKRSYTLGGKAIWRYGTNAGQSIQATSGTCEITDINEKNEVTGTFSFSGTVTTQSGVSFVLRITQGELIKVVIPPKIKLLVKPADGTKVKAGEEFTTTIEASNANSNEVLKDADLTFKVSTPAFEDIEPKKTGGNGIATFPVKTKKSIDAGNYNIIITAKKTGFIDSDPDTLKIRITTTNRYWYAKCAGIPYMEFDAGEGNEWEEGDVSGTLVAKGKNLAYAFFTVDGSISIDTTGGGRQFIATGRTFIPFTSESGTREWLAGTSYTLPLGGCGDWIDLSNLASNMKLGGVNVKTAKFRITGDYDNSLGGEIAIEVEGPKNSANGCNAKKDIVIWEAPAISSLLFELKIYKDGQGWGGSGKAALKNASTEFIPSFCFKELSVAYDSRKDSILVVANVSSPLFSEASAKAAFTNATLVNLDLTVKTTACYPIPETPLCWNGAKFSLQNSANASSAGFSMAGLFTDIPTKKTFEVEIGGGAKYPPFMVFGTGAYRMVSLSAVSATKPWQVEGVASCTLDIDNKAATIGGTVKAFHFGGDYFVDGGATLTLSMKDDLGVIGTLKGTLKVPRVGDELLGSMTLVGKFINSYTPLNLGTGSTELRLFVEGEKSMRASYDLTNQVICADPEMNELLQSIGKGTFSVDFNLLPDPRAFQWEGGFTVVKKFFGLGIGKATGSEAVQADIIKTFSVAANQSNLTIVVSHPDGNIQSSLKTPNGTVYTAKDASAGVFVVINPAKTMAMWSVKNPAAGEYSITVANGTAADTIEVYSTPIETEFVITAEQVNKEVNFTWNNTGLPEGSFIDVFADTDTSDYNGSLVASFDATLGAATIVLNDSLTPCSFTLHATRRTPTSSVKAYAPGMYQNAKSWLLPPQNVIATYNENAKLLTLSWDVSPDPYSALYSIRASVGNTPDSLLYSTFAATRSVQIPVTETPSKIRVRSFDINGRAGCEGAATDVVLSIEDQATVVQGTSISLAVAPNPAQESASVVIEVLGNRLVTADIVDINGNVVYVVCSNQNVEHQITLPFSTQNIGSGTYLLRVSTGLEVLTYPLTVLH